MHANGRDCSFACLRVSSRRSPAPGVAAQPDGRHLWSMLAADGVSKRYGDVVALDGVSVAVESGGCLALVGESGAGKSTLLRCFNRLVDPDAGRILVDGADARALDPVTLRRRTGYVAQEGGL